MLNSLFHSKITMVSKYSLTKITKYYTVIPNRYDVPHENFGNFLFSTMTFCKDMLTM